MVRGKKKTFQKKIKYLCWLVFIVLLLISSIWFSYNFTIGVFFGGLISILNFYGLERGLQSFFATLGTKDSAKSLVMGKYLFRLLLTGVALYFILTKTTANIFGLLVGLSTVVISVILSVVLIYINESYLEEV